MSHSALNSKSRLTARLASLACASHAAIGGDSREVRGLVTWLDCLYCNLLQTCTVDLKTYLHNVDLLRCIIYIVRVETLQFLRPLYLHVGFGSHDPKTPKELVWPQQSMSQILEGSVSRLFWLKCLVSKKFQSRSWFHETQNESLGLGLDHTRPNIKSLSRSHEKQNESLGLDLHLLDSPSTASYYKQGKRFTPYSQTRLLFPADTGGSSPDISVLAG